MLKSCHAAALKALGANRGEDEEEEEQEGGGGGAAGEGAAERGAPPVQSTPWVRSHATAPLLCSAHGQLAQQLSTGIIAALLTDAALPPIARHAAEYKAAEGQRERRLLLSELRNLVPLPHAALLAPALLDSELAGPPAPPASGGAAGSGGGAVTRQAAVAERAAAAARTAVLRQYPGLAPLVLSEAVKRLCSCESPLDEPAAEPTGAVAGGGRQHRVASTSGGGSAAAAGSGGTGGDGSAAWAVAWVEALLAPQIAAAAQQGSR